MGRQRNLTNARERPKPPPYVNAIPPNDVQWYLSNVTTRNAMRCRVASGWRTQNVGSNDCVDAVVRVDDDQLAGDAENRCPVVLTDHKSCFLMLKAFLCGSRMCGLLGKYSRLM